MLNNKVVLGGLLHIAIIVIAIGYRLITTAALAAGWTFVVIAIPMSIMGISAEAGFAVTAVAAMIGFAAGALPRDERWERRFSARVQKAHSWVMVRFYD